MITKRFTSLAFLFVSAFSNSVFGGVIGGGSGPPAKEALEQMLMSLESANAGLFKDKAGSVALGVKGSLESELRLSRLDFQSQSLKLADTDFDMLSTLGSRNIEATTLGNIETPSVNRSYKIEDGNSLNELVLKDRRELARDSVN